MIAVKMHMKQYDAPTYAILMSNLEPIVEVLIQKPEIQHVATVALWDKTKDEWAAKMEWSTPLDVESIDCPCILCQHRKELDAFDEKAKKEKDA